MVGCDQVGEAPNMARWHRSPGVQIAVFLLAGSIIPPMLPRCESPVSHVCCTGKSQSYEGPRGRFAQPSVLQSFTAVTTRYFTDT